MRAATFSLALQSVRDLNLSLERLQETYKVASTGIRVQTADDDPAAAARSLRLMSAAKAVEASVDSLNTGRTRLTSAESALTGAKDILVSATSTAVRGLNGATLSDADRASLAQSLNEGINQMLSLANNKENGQYTFSGWQTKTEPFSATYDSDGKVTSVSYQGDSGVVMADGGDAGDVQSNLPGDQVFTQTGADVFASLIGMRDALLANDTTALGNYYTQMQSGYENLNKATTKVGNWVSSIDDNLTRLKSSQTRLTTMYSNTVDADQTTAAVEYQNALDVYQAGLAVSAKSLSIGTLASYLK